MDKLYESKFMKTLQRFGEALAGNKVFSAISSGIMAAMGLILAGSFFQIIATILNMTHAATMTSPVYQFFITPYNMTMGLLSIVVAFTIGFSYAKSLGMKTVINGINSMILFLLVASPATTVILKDGKTSFTGLDTTSLGGVGLFTAIIIGILSVRITYFFEKHKIAIRMPDAVPQFLQDSFSTLIPFAFNILLWHGLNTLVKQMFSVTLPIAIANILGMPLHALTSVPGMVICFLVATLLWSFGIHGSLVVFTVLMPVYIQAITQNGALVAAGKPAQFAPVLLFMTIASCGGTGNTLPLVVMGLRSKSEQIKAVSKAALIPGIFNINEPVAFGYPIMYNPILAVPYILNTLIFLLLAWAGYAVGFFKPDYVLILTALPLGVAEFLRAMSWHNALLPVLGFIVSFVIFRPFYKVYERQLVEKEEAASEVDGSRDLAKENA